MDGRFELLARESGQIFAYTRDDGKQRLLVVCNFSGEPADSGLAEEWKSMELLLGNYPDSQGDRLRPYEARMYLQKCRQQERF